MASSAIPTAQCGICRLLFMAPYGDELFKYFYIFIDMEKESDYRNNLDTCNFFLRRRTYGVSQY